MDRCRFNVRASAAGVFWQQVHLPRIVVEERCNVLWGPHGTLPVRLQPAGVVTVHDLTSITRPASHRLRTVLSFNTFIGRSLAQAGRIAAVSRKTADELIRGFAIDAGKIVVVPNGVDEFFSPAAGPDEEMLPSGLSSRDYILFVGTIEPRKGVDHLLAAWESLPEPRPKLVLCGERGWGRVAKLESAIANEQVVMLSYVDRVTLRALYRHALFFVYPSLEEGFGIPPLEAMACGSPVIASRTGAIAEYLDGAGIVIEPGDLTGLSEALRILRSSSSLREELSAAGVERAKEWRWDRSASLMTEMFREAAEG
ncbi:MAG TPA: glycosyltransferase family 1 protein [Thermoanaerobaculia bacterium]|nr:glycosyltransferase family 1 protein [Thermoanaerobaculia bacterium]